MAKIINIGIVGAGKLGELIIDLAKNYDFNINIVIVREKTSEINSIYHSDFSKLSTCDMIIDVSTSDNPFIAINTAEEYGIPIIIAATGIKDIKDLADYKTSIMFLPNASFSWNIISFAIKLLVQIDPEYKFCLSDIHHKHKKDSPSGTIRALISSIGEKNIESVNSMRIGEIVGIHNINGYSKNDMIKIEHQVFARETFARGILIAARWFFEQKKGLYIFDDMLLDTIHNMK